MRNRAWRMEIWKMQGVVGSGGGGAVGIDRGGTDLDKALEAWSQFISSHARLGANSCNLWHSNAMAYLDSDMDGDPW